MKIEKVKIQNWRSIKQIEIDFQDIMIFIGQNNHGKSNILYALLFFFGQINHSELDFNEISKDFFVEVIFNDLDDFDKNQFKKYFTSDNKIKVRKTGLQDGGISYNGYVENPSKDWLKEDRISDFTTREIAEALPLIKHLPKSGRISKDAFREAQMKYIEENREKLTFNYELETLPFLGAKNVAKGIFGDVFFIPAVKNAAEELNVKGNTTFSQLYSDVINNMSDNNEEYKTAKSKMIELSKILNKLDEEGTENIRRPIELTNLETKLRTELAGWNATIDIEITPPNIDEIFRLGANVWINDGIRTDVNRKGHGLQRALIFALIKSWSALIKEKRITEEIEPENGNGGDLRTRRSSHSTYFIFEEPELYLHPQAQKELFYSLTELSKSRNQIILSTHSSFFIDLDFYKSICIIIKNNLVEGTTILQFTGELFPESESARNFKMTSWINPDRGELFFAKKVILVEGQTDKTIIPNLAYKINKFRFDYSVIDCAGKHNIPNYIVLLNKFKIPYTVVYDKDHQSYKTIDGLNIADKISKEIEALIDKSIGISVILDNDIEEEIGIFEEKLRDKPYTALLVVEDESFKMANSLKSKIETIYS